MPYTAVIIDDVPGFDPPLSEHWFGVHIEDGKGFADLWWFRDVTFDAEGWAGCSDCRTDDGEPVDDDLFQAASDAWGEALFEHITPKYERYYDI